MVIDEEKCYFFCPEQGQKKDLSLLQKYLSPLQRISDLWTSSSNAQTNLLNCRGLEVQIPYFFLTLFTHTTLQIFADLSNTQDDCFIGLEK